jgi:hypothetical protein
MFFDAGKTEAALGAVVPPKAPASQNRNLSKDQFGGKSGGGNPTEGEAPMEGAAGAGEAGAAGAAGGAEAAELLPLLLV